MSHSEIRGSKVICTYPRLIAAYHVLHRLREPRHPPCALFCFAVLRPAMIIKPRRELILSAVVFHAPRSCRDATTGGSRRAQRKVLYSLDCHNMSKIDVHSLFNNNMH